MKSSSVTSTSKAFPAVRNSLPKNQTARETRDSSAMFRTRNNSVIDSIESVGGKRNFGFRNHSFALGSAVRHFQTISNFPEMPSKLERVTDRTNIKQIQKNTIKKVPAMMDALNQDPRALEIFMEELALADKTQPKHLQFLANMPHTISGQTETKY